MSAKHKLNSANALAACFVAALIGGMTGSFTVFLVAVVVLVLAAFHSGEIRR